MYISIHGFEEFPDKDGNVEAPFWDLEIVGYYGHRWRDRLKGIWKLVKGEKFAACYVALDEKTTEEIRKELDRILTAYQLHRIRHEHTSKGWA